MQCNGAVGHSRSPGECSNCPIFFQKRQLTSMDTSQLPGRGIKPLLSLRKHYRVSLFISLLVVLIGLPVAWIKGQSVYTVESVFQVSPNYMKTLSSDKEVEFQSNSQYREFVEYRQALRRDPAGFEKTAGSKNRGETARIDRAQIH